MMGTARGFTLFELLVVIALISLLLAVIPLAFPKAIEQTKLRGATRELANALKVARSRAVSGVREIPVALDVQSRVYAVDESQQSLDLPADAHMVLTTAGVEQTSTHAGAIRSFPDGSSTGGRIALSLRNTQYVVDVNWLSGRVTITP